MKRACELINESAKTQKIEEPCTSASVLEIKNYSPLDGATSLTEATEQQSGDHSEETCDENVVDTHSSGDLSCKPGVLNDSLTVSNSEIIKNEDTNILIFTDNASQCSDNIQMQPEDVVTKIPAATSDVNDNDDAEERLLDSETAFVFHSEDVSVPYSEDQPASHPNIEPELPCFHSDNIAVEKLPSETEKNNVSDSEDEEILVNDDFLGDSGAVYELPRPQSPILPNIPPEEDNMFMYERRPPEYFDDMIYVTNAWEEFAKPIKNQPNFLKGCKWAPDGTCLLTASEDTVLRIYDLPTELHCQNSWSSSQTLPHMKPALEIREGDRIYDFAWYPLMNSTDQSSCCIASATSGSPVHVWDAFTGELRSSYLSYNSVEELIAPYCLTFSPCGEKMYCGFKDEIRVFDISRPGRSCERRVFKPSQNIYSRVYGIVSTVAVCAAKPSIYAVGTFTKIIALCSEPNGKLLGTLKGHKGGITHLQFSPDGTKLYSGGRNDGEIRVWDVRNYKYEIYVIAKRTVTTNQRIYFDISSDGNFLVSGTTTTDLLVWDTRLEPVKIKPAPTMLPVKKLAAHSDCVNGVSIHRQYPILATTSGQRHFAILNEDSDDEDGPLVLPRKVNVEDPENCVKLWWIGRASNDD